MLRNYLSPQIPPTPRSERSEDAGLPLFNRHPLSPFSRRGLAASPLPCNTTTPTRGHA